MAEIPISARLTDLALALRQVVVTPGLRRDRVRAATLELALALLETAACQDSATKSLEALAGETAVVERWTRDCAELLSAIAKPLAGLAAAARGDVVPTNASSLPAAAARFAATTIEADTELKQAAESLKAANRQMLRRAGELGALKRSAQLEETLLADDIVTCETVEKRHREVAERRGGVVKRIEELQARSQLCETDPEEIERFEAEVVEREAKAKQRQRRVAELEERLRQSEVIPEDIERLEAEVRDREEKLRARTGEAGILVKRVKMLQEEHASLSERVEHTRRLIADLEASPDRRTFLAVQRIWDALPHHVTGRTS